MYTEKELWKNYEIYTQLASSVARKLAYGFLGLCWILKENHSGNFPPLIYMSLIFIGLFFFFDGLQYCLGAIRRRNVLYSIYAPKKNTLKEVGKNKNGEMLYEWPDNFDKCIYCIWTTKLIILALALLFLIIEVSMQL